MKMMRWVVDEQVDEEDDDEDEDEERRTGP